MNDEGYVLIENNEPQYPNLPASCTIFVSNVSNKANEKSLREFFGICGQIKSVTLETHGENQSASITFENDEAAKTAIFLNDTFMFDGTINVIPYTEHIGNNENKSQNNNNNNDNNNNNNNTQQPKEEQQTNSFWVNSLASAYMFGSKAWQKVLEFDDKHKISATINEKANQIDQSLKITERSKVAAQKLGEIAENIDHRLSIKEKTQQIGSKTNETLTNLRERNEKTQNFFQKLDEVGKKIGNTWEDAMKRAQQKIDIVKSEIKRREEEEKTTNVLSMEEISTETNVTVNTPLLTEHHHEEQLIISTNNETPQNETPQNETPQNVDNNNNQN